MRDIDELEGDPRLKDLVWEMLNLHAKKQNDYGQQDDPFANLRSSKDFGVEPYRAALIRMNDKVTRLKRLAQGFELMNESGEDSLLDISLYALITLILLKEHTDEG